MKFKDFYYKTIQNTSDVSEEQMFFDVVGVKIPSLKSFIAWLVLKNIIKPYIRASKKSKPKTLDSLSKEEKINFLVKEVPNLKELSIYFSNIFKK